MHDNRDLEGTIAHITDAEVAAVIRYLDPTRSHRTTSESDDTIIVVVIAALMFLLAALPFISLFLKTS